MSKKLNIIEAMKMPIGTEFNIVNDGNKVFLKEFDEDDNGKCLYWKENSLISESQVYITDETINYIFIPIQQPVSFMEAVEKSKANRFRIEHELLKSHAKSGHTLLTTLDILARYFNNDQITDILLNGKCYIEESEELEDERLS